MNFPADDREYYIKCVPAHIYVNMVELPGNETVPLGTIGKHSRWKLTYIPYDTADSKACLLSMVDGPSYLTVGTVEDGQPVVRTPAPQIWFLTRSPNEGCFGIYQFSNSVNHYWKIKLDEEVQDTAVRLRTGDLDWQDWEFVPVPAN